MGQFADSFADSHLVVGVAVSGEECVQPLPIKLPFMQIVFAYSTLFSLLCCLQFGVVLHCLRELNVESLSI